MVEEAIGDRPLGFLNPCLMDEGGIECRSRVHDDAAHGRTGLSYLPTTSKDNFQPFFVASPFNCPQWTSPCCRRQWFIPSFRCRSGLGVLRQDARVYIYIHIHTYKDGSWRLGSLRPETTSML